MRALFLAWQDPVDRSWRPVGKLTNKEGEFRFVYTKGAAQSRNFTPFGLMTDLSQEYRSKELFPLFANRIMPENRPEYDEFLDWLGLASDDTDPLSQLERSGGVRQTDSLQVFSVPTKSADGLYRVKFFSHGVRHMSSEAIKRVDALEVGEVLHPMHDFQNEHDQDAIALRTSDPPLMVGYCPRFLAKDIHVLNSKCFNEQRLQIYVERINREAPIQFRLMCQLTAVWPDGFEPCSGAEFEELSSRAD